MAGIKSILWILVILRGLGHSEILKLGMGVLVCTNTGKYVTWNDTGNQNSEIDLFNLFTFKVALQYSKYILFYTIILPHKRQRSSAL